MEGNRHKILFFTDLVAWQEAHQLVLSVYEISRDFPKSEEFGLKSQMRRAAVSITSNIAEGFSRRNSLEKSHFYFIAQGSNTELQNQLLIAKDIGYINEKSFKSLRDKSVTVHKLVNGLIKRSRNTLPLNS